jgi:hypothetical protein
MNIRIGQEVLWYRNDSPVPLVAVLVDLVNAKAQLRLGAGMAARYVWVDPAQLAPCSGELPQSSSLEHTSDFFWNALSQPHLRPRLVKG